MDQISLSFEQGKNYCILGKNGSGKSSLVMTIMGNPLYTVENGEIILNGENITTLTPDERAKRGIFLTFQNIPEIPGVKLFEFLKEIHDQKNGTTTFLAFKKKIEPLLEELHISKEFLRRELNVWFSGGEKRMIEILQMIGEENTSENSFIIITHTFSLLEHLPIDTVYVIKDGKKEKEAWSELIEQIKKEGFQDA